MCTSCRSSKMLSNAYFLAKFRFDTAENEPAKILQKFSPFSPLFLFKSQRQGCVRGSASLPERATEHYPYGFPHRWSVGRIYGWFTHSVLVGLYGRYGHYGLSGRYGWYGPIGLYGVYGVYGRWRGAHLTNLLFARTCILVFEHRALVYPCQSRFGCFRPRSFRRPRAFSPLPLKRVRGGKKRKRGKKKKKRKKFKKKRKKILSMF